MPAETDTLKLSYAYGTSPLTPTSLTEPLKTYLFGYPIAHSLAPLLHNTLFSALNTNWNYSLIESTNFDDFLPKLKADNCIGSAVTMPHKVNFISQVDDLTEEGRMIGAINTIFLRLDAAGNKRYIGTNTDCIGIREAFLQNHPDILSRSAGKPAVIVGGGGACRSAVYACWKWLGASQIYLVNRIPEEVTAIIDAFKAAGCPANLIHVATLEQAQALETPVVVIGTVPDFPPKEPGEILARKIVEEFLQRDVQRAEGATKGYVHEMCYHPHPITAFYKLSENNGWAVIPGTEAMIHQGIAQQVLWAEKKLEEFPVDQANAVIRKALEEARQEKH